MIRCRLLLLTAALTLTTAALPAFAEDAAAVQTEQTFQQAFEKLKAKDFTEAAKLFRQAGSAGHRESQYYLGLMYARGDGVPQDYRQARDWLYKAAMNGFPKAQYHLGEMYVWGDGVDVDYEEATVWFWLATTFGDKFAQKRLRAITSRISPEQLADAKKRTEELWRQMPHDLAQKKNMLMH